MIRVDTAYPRAGLGFDAQQQETTTPRELAVSGTFPSWLTGSLLRNGPGDWSAGSTSLRHWFDGFALLHHFSFDGGRVHYASRFLQSAARQRAEAAGELAVREFATDPCRSIFRRVQSLFDPGNAVTDNANVSVQRLGDRFIAMTETPLPVIFDRQTLDRTGLAYKAPGQITTAHPHYERGSGALINYAARLGARSSYRVFRVDPDTTAVEELARVPVREPAYMHSFGISRRYFVLAEFPLVVNPLRLALSDQPFIANYRWKPERGTVFTVIDRSSGAVVARLRGEACFGFHHINAYDDGDSLVVDICVADDASVIDELYLNRLRDRFAEPRTGAVDYPRPTRFTLDLARSTVTSRRLSDEFLDLPTVNNRLVRERPYSTAWGVGSDGVWHDRLIALDVTTGQTRTWREPSTYPGEPIFVARPEATREDDGVLLTVALNADHGTSSLVALDARSLEPLGRADVGHPIPYGFHGLYTS